VSSKRGSPRTIAAHTVFMASHSPALKRNDGTVFQEGLVELFATRDASLSELQAIIVAQYARYSNEWGFVGTATAFDPLSHAALFLTPQLKRSGVELIRRPLGPTA
jgi:hypothetical protein